MDGKARKEDTSPNRVIVEEEYILWKEIKGRMVGGKTDEVAKEEEDARKGG